MSSVYKDLSALVEDKKRFEREFAEGEALACQRDTRITELEALVCEKDDELTDCTAKLDQVSREFEGEKEAAKALEQQLVSEKREREAMYQQNSRRIPAENQSAQKKARTTPLHLTSRDDEMMVAPGYTQDPQYVGNRNSGAMSPQDYPRSNSQRSHKSPSRSNTYASPVLQFRTSRETGRPEKSRMNDENAADGFQRNADDQYDGKNEAERSISGEAKHEIDQSSGHGRSTFVRSGTRRVAFAKESVERDQDTRSKPPTNKRLQKKVTTLEIIEL